MYDTRLELIDQAIAEKKAEIESLETQMQKPLHPISMRVVLIKAEEAGLFPENIAPEMCIDMED